jgi:hypothetical protein
MPRTSGAPATLATGFCRQVIRMLEIKNLNLELKKSGTETEGWKFGNHEAGNGKKSERQHQIFMIS